MRPGTAGTVRWIEDALALGITSFDHADIYGGYRVRTLFGDARAAAPSLRQRLQTVAKCSTKLASEQLPAHPNKFQEAVAALTVAPRTIRPSGACSQAAEALR